MPTTEEQVRRHARECEEDAVEDGAHGDIPGEHVVEVHQVGPAELGRHIRAQQREQHAHNVQHHALSATSM